MAKSSNQFKEKNCKAFPMDLNVDFLTKKQLKIYQNRKYIQSLEGGIKIQIWVEEI